MGCVSCVGLVKELESDQNDISLRLKEPTTIPIEAECICPDLFVDRNYQEILDFPLYYGRRKRRLGDLFTVEGEKSDLIHIDGDVKNVKRIGSSMTRGKIVVHGSVGMHVGASMKGGMIFVEGDAGDKAGISMQGGRLWIKGNAGHQTGAGRPGENHGVNRGVIVVEGNAGAELGACMRRGLIVVLGNAGDFVGAKMVAGTVMVFGHIGRRAGAGMKRGSVVSLGTIEPLLPTYHFESIVQPVDMGIFSKYLKNLGVLFDPSIAEGLFQRYSGDINAFGKGEILIRVEH